MESGVLAGLQERFAAAGYQVQNATIEDREALVARRSDFRWGWVATRLHTFVIVFLAEDVDEALADALTSAARRYAIEHKGGLWRGLQTGTVTVVVVMTTTSETPVRRWFSTEAKPKRAALLFPVLVELSTGSTTFFRGRLRLGWIYGEHLRSVVEMLIVPTVRPRSR